MSEPESAHRFGLTLVCPWLGPNWQPAYERCVYDCTCDSGRVAVSSCVGTSVYGQVFTGTKRKAI